MLLPVTRRLPAPLVPIFPPSGYNACIVRILILTHTYSVHIQRWHHGLQIRGHQVKVLVREGALAPDVSGPPAWAQRLAPVRKIWQLFAFFALLVTFRPQVLHQHWFEVPRLARFFPRRLPLVISVWGADIVREWREDERVAARRYAARATVVLGSSQFLADEATRFLARPVERLYWGVDLARFSPRPTEPREEFRIGFLKHLLPKYGPDVALRAFAQLVPDLPTASLHLYGDGDMRAELVADAERLGVSTAVHFHGKIPYDEVPDALAMFDVMVMPSRDASETLGVAALEAQAMGIPVVASDIGGVPEAVRDGDGGLLVPPNDPATLAEALRYLARHYDTRARLGRQGRAHVCAHFDWTHTLEEMDAVYRRVTGA